MLAGSQRVGMAQTALQSTPASANRFKRAKTRSNQLASSDLARTKDISLHPGFRGEISRALWRLWVCRLTPAAQYLVGVTALFVAFGSNSMQVQAYIPVAYLIALWAVSIVCTAVVKPRAELKISHSGEDPVR